MGYEFVVLICIILFLASLVHGSVGFGFPMIATPLIALFTDIQSAIIYTLIPTLLVNIISLKSEGSILLAYKRFWLLALLATTGSILGTTLLIYFNSDLFKLLLAFMILFYLSLEFIKFEFRWIKEHPRNSQVLFGISAGLLGGLTNAMAPILMVYTLESKFSKKEIIQASNVCFLSGKVVQIFIFTFASAFHLEQLSISAFSLIFVVLAIFIGIKLKSLINAEVYKKIIKGILFIIAIMLLIQTL